MLPQPEHVPVKGEHDLVPSPAHELLSKDNDAPLGLDNGDRPLEVGGEGAELQVATPYLRAAEGA